MKKTLLMCAMAIGLSAMPASAIMITPTSVTLAATDVGSSFVIAYGGLLPDLEAFAQFRLTAYTATSATFDVRIANTSDTNSRVSAFGFSTDPNTTSGSVGANPYGFSTVYVDNNPANPDLFPNLGHIEVCTSGGSTCVGGAQPGVVDGQLSNFFSFTLNFSSLGSTLVLTDFGIRYQSVGPNEQDSSTGFGNPPPPGTPTPFDVPEPTSMVLLGLGLLAAGLARRRK